MEMLTSGKLSALLSLLLIWAFTGDSQRVEIPRKDMEVIEGQTVVLQAWYTPTSEISKNTVIWNFMANDSTQVISYSSGQIGIGSPEFRKRVGFSLTMPSTNLSIFINHTQEADSGRYLCNVIIPGAPGLSGELRLSVKVPPSVPVCEMTGQPVLRGNVTLSCRSSAGKPVPQYKWTKSAPLSEVFFSPMQNEKLGTLRLSNLTKNMSGKYVCRASNTAGSESCFINLEVSASINAGVIAGATVGSVVGFVAIVLFLVFILRRKKDTEEDMSNDIKEDAQAPKRVSWAKSGTGSDIVSKNGTLSSIATSPPPQDLQRHHHQNHQQHNHHHNHHQQHNHHHHHQQHNHNHQQHNHFPHRPASDTASITTATGSMTGFQVRPGEQNPLQGLPGYHAPGSTSRGSLSPSSSSLHRTEGPQAQPPAHRPAPVPVGVTASNLSRMGAVPVMVPAQNQAGSLV
ncbi:endothelial cell-selective adhesion molecule [Anguilla anguilla]|uniref:endothelial cell-selective adhesion molecule n=1 Tax=Anguilla anguilla TaxID=7936 RepID=UPI0015A7A999|nr:endothelial cell-selective adhesion molecule [Anguilla anguilla]